MTAASYVTDLTTFWLESATTVTAIGTGGAGLGNPETDFFIQGTDCISKGAWTNAIKGFIVDGLGTSFTVPTDGAVIYFAKYDAQGSLDTQTNGGLQMIIGDSSSSYDHFYIAGKDTIEFDSWFPYVIDPNNATADTTTGGGSSGTERWVGILADLPTTSGPTKGNPIAIDAVRYGRCRIDYTLGDVTPNGPATFTGAEAAGNVNSTRWGLLELQQGAYQTQGFHSIGTSGTAVDFRDADKVLFWRKQALNLTNDAISTAFNRVEIINSSTICEWTNIIWSALGTRSKGTFVHTAGTCDLDICQFFDWGTFTFLAAANVTACTFSGCDTITAPASVMTGTKIAGSTVTADTGALVYNSATDTDGKLDDMTFEQGSAAHHAIDFGTSVTSEITLRGIEFTGFSGTADADGATVRFLATGGSLNLNLIDCTVDGGGPTWPGNFGVDDAAGISVTVVISPKTTKITVEDADGTLIENARVFLETADNGGGSGFPYEASVSTLTQSSGTATLTASAVHGLANNDYVVIRDAGTEGYNKVAQITVTSTTVFTYSVDSGLGSPAGGTPIFSYVPVYGLTNSSGVVQSSKTWGASQAVKGWARKSTSSPFYKQTAISISDASGGTDLLLALQPDE